MVQATDGGRYDAHSRHATVVVIIDDANDHAPVLAEYPFKASVSARTPPGTAVVSVTARDKDLGANGQITYRWVAVWRDMVKGGSCTMSVI